MTLTALPATQVITIAGVTLTMTAVDGTNGNSFQNNGSQILRVKNGSGASMTVTPDAYPTGNNTIPPAGVTVTDKAITIAAGAEMDIGPFPPSIYNNASNVVGLTWSSGTTVTAATYQYTPNNN